MLANSDVNFDVIETYTAAEAKFLEEYEKCKPGTYVNAEGVHADRAFAIAAAVDRRRQRKGSNDAINPKHYDKYAIQPYDFITKNGLGFAEGNVIKYVCRWRDKNGVEDLKKARAYLDKLIAAHEVQ